MNSELIEVIEVSLLDKLNPKSAIYDKSKVVTYGYFYLYDKKEIYSKAILEIDQKEMNERLKWILWIRIAPDAFFEMTDNLKSKENIIRAKVCSPILFYEELSDLEVSLIFEMGKEINYPKIKILENNSVLYNDFINGVNKDKYIEWQKRLGGIEQREDVEPRLLL